MGERLFGGLSEELSPLLLELFGSHGCTCQLLSQFRNKKKLTKARSEESGEGWAIIWIPLFARYSSSSLAE
jgi:hypothetical protein